MVERGGRHGDVGGRAVAALWPGRSGRDVNLRAGSWDGITRGPPGQLQGNCARARKVRPARRGHGHAAFGFRGGLDRTWSAGEGATKPTTYVALGLFLLQRRLDAKSACGGWHVARCGRHVSWELGGRASVALTEAIGEQHSTAQHSTAQHTARRPGLENGNRLTRADEEDGDEDGAWWQVWDVGPFVLWAAAGDAHGVWLPPLRIACQGPAKWGIVVRQLSTAPRFDDSGGPACVGTQDRDAHKA